MRMTATGRAVLAYLATVPFPEDIDFDVWPDGVLMIQASDQDAVRRVQACFPGVLWTEGYTTAVPRPWWQYDGVTATGIRVHIYACWEPAVAESIDPDDAGDAYADDPNPDEEIPF